jgi:hypothetical protein
VIEFTKKQFDEIKYVAEERYKKVGSIHCPVLKLDVAFNAKGLDHIKLKSWNKARNEKDQYTRLKLLHLVPEIITHSHTLQGEMSGNRFERVKINSRWEHKMCLVNYFEFIAIVHSCRLRVIVKRVNGGPAYFWSVVPYWKQGNDRKKRMFEGNPEDD